MTRARMVLPPTSRRPLSPPPNRAAWPPARITPTMVPILLSGISFSSWTVLSPNPCPDANASNSYVFWGGNPGAAPLYCGGYDGDGMIDPFGRHISYLRVSVTDRCD